MAVCFGGSGAVTSGGIAGLREPESRSSAKMGKGGCLTNGSAVVSRCENRVGADRTSADPGPSKDTALDSLARYLERIFFGVSKPANYRLETAAYCGICPYTGGGRAGKVPEKTRTIQVVPSMRVFGGT